jgi:hypothetical protein
METQWEILRTGSGDPRGAGLYFLFIFIFVHGGLLKEFQNWPMSPRLKPFQRSCAFRSALFAFVTTENFLRSTFKLQTETCS